MDNMSMTATLDSQGTSSQPTSQNYVEVSADDTSNGQAPQPESQNYNTEAQWQHTTPENPTPVKRGPGRPKGSGKKQQPLQVAENSPDSTIKVKRPVGRPRRDGLPAGSVSPKKTSGKPGRPRKNGSEAPSTSYNEYMTFPPQDIGEWKTNVAPSASANPAPSTSAVTGNHTITPDNTEWAKLARTQPRAFIQELITSLAAPNPVSRAGLSLEEAFKSHLVSLAPNPAQKQASQTIPSLYSILKTFWLPSSPAYFSMTSSTSTSRVPSEHRFLYWDPQPLIFNGIACPFCAGPLENRGRIKSGPIKVYDLDRPFFIIGCEYGCKSPHCVAHTSTQGRRFASTDSSILRALPPPLREEFPAHHVQGETDMGPGPEVWNWQAMCVSRPLWNMVRGCLQAGLGKDAIIQIVRAIQNGVVNKPEYAQEEEEEEEPEEQDAPVQPQPSTSGPPPVFKPNGEYNPVWIQNAAAAAAAVAVNNNSGAEDAASNPASASATGAPSAVSSSAPNPPPPPQQSGYPPQGTSPYTLYPYNAPYPYFTPQVGDVTSDSPKSKSKRPADTEGPLGEPQKRTRHCCKCGSQECKGKGGRSFCTNTCQDCGKVECKGRNSRRPDKKCDEAWG